MTTAATTTATTTHTKKNDNINTAHQISGLARIDDKVNKRFDSTTFSTGFMPLRLSSLLGDVAVVASVEVVIVVVVVIFCPSLSRLHECVCVFFGLYEKFQSFHAECRGECVLVCLCVCVNDEAAFATSNTLNASRLSEYATYKNCHFTYPTTSFCVRVCVVVSQSDMSPNRNENHTHNYKAVLAVFSYDLVATSRAGLFHTEKHTHKQARANYSHVNALVLVYWL